MVTGSADQRTTLDVKALRREFPVLDQQVSGHRLVYLDNAATSQKPRQVIEALVRYYERDNANVHRGLHELSTRATEAYEAARGKVAAFIGASDPAEVVFTRGATEAINLVAASWGLEHVGADDRILLTLMDHHSNIVPWQLLARRVGAHLDYLEIDDDGRLRLDRLEEQLTERTRIVAFAHVSNSLGTINPVAEIAEQARSAGAITVVDGAQAAPHLRVNVAELGCDFYAFSGHKMCGPTGVGALWGRRELLEAMPPYHGGGEMIERVELEASTYKPPPHKFEAGTPNIAGAIGLAAAVDFLTGVGLERIGAHEGELLTYALDRLRQVPGLRVFGPDTDRLAVISFAVDGIHPHDLAQFLNDRGVAVRAGHHCNQPLMQRLGVPATTRASLYLYNDRDDIDALCDALHGALDFF